jgi:ABC-2 type transport system ATP-binding protein
VLGLDVLKRPLKVRRRIASVIQETTVDLLLSVRDNLLTLPVFIRLNRPQHSVSPLTLWGASDSPPRPTAKCRDLSGGFRRRVQVAKTFMVNTPELFVDEFSTGMDPLLKREVMALLRGKRVAAVPSCSPRKF